MIVNKNDVTNELFFKYDLLAVESTIPGHVEIIKNRYTGETGIFEKSYYNGLISQFESKNKSKRESIMDSFPEDFKELFGALTEKVENVIDEAATRAKEAIETAKPEVEKFAGDLMDTIQKVELEAEIAKLEVVRDTAVEMGVATGGFLKKVEKKIKQLKETSEY